MKIVAISGWKQSGKDTGTDYLVKTYGAIRTAFADPLKDAVTKEFGILRSWCDDSRFKEEPLLHMPVNPQDAFSCNLCEFMTKEFRTADGRAPLLLTTNNRGLVFTSKGDNEYLPVFWTPRALCILTGSVKRTVDSSYWVKQAIRQIREMDSPVSDLHVISDLRYQSEARQLREAFGADVVFVRINRWEKSQSQDPSETDLNEYGFDYYVENKGSVDEFHQKLDDVIAKIRFAKYK